MKFFSLVVIATLAQHNAARLRSQRFQKTSNPSAVEEGALRKLAVVEDLRTSRILCRLPGAQGQGSATVRLQPQTNVRSLVFNDDAEGAETEVRCEGAADPQCVAQAMPHDAHAVEDCPACPCRASGELFGPFAIAMAEETDRRCHGGGPTPTRILLLGLGAGELANHIVQVCDQSGSTGVELDAVELDGRLPVLASRFFGLPEKVQVTVGDALTVVLEKQQTIADNELLAEQRRYDVVLVDCFSTGGVTPEHCRSSQFVQALHAIIQDGGSVLHHLWHDDQRHPEVKDEFNATIALYEEIFACPNCTGHVSIKPLQFSGAPGPDSLVIATATQSFL